MKNKRKYPAEEIIKSIDGIERAEPGYFLLTRIQQRIQNKYETIPRGLRRALVPVYASLALFLVINIASYIHFNGPGKVKQEQNQNPTEAFASEYGLQPDIY